MTIIQSTWENERGCNQYKNKIILAPMVRTNSLPFRLLCIKFGADIVYTEELIDYSLVNCRRVNNLELDTIDFINDQDKVILRTCASERDRLVVQIGSNNPERALKAAHLVCHDAIGIDFNFGCPKPFSIKGGMGAALLDNPDTIRALLTTCSQNLQIPVTCKIRLLPTLEETLELVQMIEASGASAVAVHGRTRHQRSHCDNNDDHLRSIAHTLSIPMIANGASNTIKTYDDIIRFRERTNASSVMIARAAMQNPSIFGPTNCSVSMHSIVAEFLRLCVRYHNYMGNTKFTAQALMAATHYDGHFKNKFHQTHDYKTMCELFGLQDWYRGNYGNTILYGRVDNKSRREHNQQEISN